MEISMDTIAEVSYRSGTNRARIARSIKMEREMKAGRFFLALIGVGLLLAALARVEPIGATSPVLSPGDIAVANLGSVNVIDPQTGASVATFCCFGRLVGIAIDASG